MDHQFLNDDVVTETLLKLPVQSLLRFKTVCKSWCSIIDSSAFRKLHLHKQLNNNDDDDTVFLQFNCDKNKIWELSIMLIDNGKSYKNFPAVEEFLNNNFKFPDIGVAGPVNGLICLLYKDSHCEGARSPSPSIAICNPSLGKIKILPTSPICTSFSNSHYYWIFLDNMEFDVDHVTENFRKVPTMCCNIGFGFDYVTKNYKIVQLCLPYEGQRHMYVEVYSGKKDTWRELATDFLAQDLLIIKPIKSSSHNNGSFVHWRASLRNEHIILSFDVQNEVFQTMLFPNYENREEFRKSKVFLKNDSFVLIVYPRRHRNLEQEDKW